MRHTSREEPVFGEDGDGVDEEEQRVEDAAWASELGNPSSC